MAHPIDASAEQAPPLTQEVLADALGLSVQYVNQTLRQLAIAARQPVKAVIEVAEARRYQPRQQADSPGHGMGIQ